MKISMSWSGGKDSAMALYRLLQDERYEVVNLHTVIGEDSGCVPMHEVPVELIREQAAAVGLPLLEILLPSVRSNDVYEQRMKAFVARCKAQDIEGLAYGDIYLEDLRHYRENMLEGTGLQAVFPIWKEPTPQLMKEFMSLGFQTCLCAVDKSRLSPAWLGRTLDKALLTDLPANVDPCGENGEYHSFVYNAPYFKRAVAFTTGQVYERRYPSPAAGGDFTVISYLPLHPK